MYVCVCNAITEKQVREAVAAGATTLDDLQLELGLASCCGTCVEAALACLPSARTETAPMDLVAMEAVSVRWVSRGPRRSAA